ncbi:MAG: hypothetical protein EZS28_020726 [Streblomastix strix]|uniref:Uncharacterized protein n=1 Tax=Streblomastix strix TaxID=222440 RepID=A0A5J4VM80_9EUKA|nr:MAG: hypothetical protein EZS28_020726 [Streblomastix strix]
MSRLLRYVLEGRNGDDQPSFSPQPALSKSCIEQIEEEGGNEDVESQLINNERYSFGWNITNEANETKKDILNLYINRINT